VRHVDTFEAALAALHERSWYDRGFISNPFAGDDAARLGLRRTRAMLDHLGNPERDYAIVHVAGSKGKGSTCVFIDAILRASGRRTGRYLSPHLHSWRERFVVDDAMVPEDAFTELTRETVAAAEAIEARQPALGTVTAFELTTAMALLYFREQGCDVAIVEVGLGGTLDATNVVTPAVSVIAPLDFEHTAILGSTMAEIAANKAGIIKPGRPVVSAAQPAEGLAVIERRAATCEAPLLVAGRDFATSGTDRTFTVTGPWGTIDNLRTGLAGQHQVENAALAIAAVHALGWDGVVLEAIQSGLRDAALPGRFEQIALDTGQTVVIDGAHSGRSAAALAAAVRDRFPDRAVTIVIGMLRDKDPAAILTPLLGIASQWIAVAPDSPRALPAAEVVAHLVALGARASMASSVAAGIEEARRLADPVILVTGSLTTVADARAALGLV
jgi:dihydrofolate synthase / folylpolyglutamate synthase